MTALGISFRRQDVALRLLAPLLSEATHLHLGILSAGRTTPPGRPAPAASPPKSVSGPRRRTAPPLRALRTPLGATPLTADVMAARQAPASKAPRNSCRSPWSPPLPASAFPEPRRLLPLLLLPPLLVPGAGGACSVPVAGSYVQPGGRRGGSTPERCSCRASWAS